jgi:hypothetical protein
MRQCKLPQTKTANQQRWIFSYRITLEHEDQYPTGMRERAAHQHRPCDSPVRTLAPDQPQVREAQRDLEAQDAEHVEWSASKVDLRVYVCVHARAGRKWETESPAGFFSPFLSIEKFGEEKEEAGR